MHSSEACVWRLIKIILRGYKKRRYVLRVAVQLQFETGEWSNDDFRLAMSEAMIKGWIEETGLMISLTESGRVEAER